MYKILKFSWEDRHKHYWVSDLHTNHDPNWPVPIWKSRGYSSADECREHQLEEINSRVSEDSILWNLGDNFLNSTDDQVIEWYSKIKCKNVYYLFGNHESVLYRLYKNMVKESFGIDQEIYPFNGKLLPNIHFLGNHQEILIGKKQIIMNHFPLRIWHKDSRSSWMLSGHSHLMDIGRRPESPIQKGLDCGWDYKKSVWSFSEIEDVMSTKSVKILDHDRDH